MTGEVGEMRHDTAALEEQVKTFAYNVVTGASDARCTFAAAGILAQELGFKQPTDGLVGAREATMLASGPQATEELYTPGLRKYTTADHIRGLAHTIGRAQQLTAEEKVTLLDSMIYGAMIGHSDHTHHGTELNFAASLKKYEFEGVIRNELDAATFHSSGSENTSLVKTHRLFVETRTHKIVSRVLAAAWAD